MASKLTSLFLRSTLRSTALSAHTPIRIPAATRSFSTPPTADANEQSPPGADEQGSSSGSASAAGEEGQDSSYDPFLHGSGKGLVFAKLTGTGRNTLKTDVINFFEGCNLSTEDVKVDYNGAYNPTAMMVQFPSRSAFDTAVRLTIRKGRLYKLEKVDRSQWDLLEAYNGNVVMLQGIPRSALLEDIERFLSGCNFDASNTRIFLRAGFPDPIKVALVHFPSHSEAMNAFRLKNRSFCLNNPILMRVLQ